MVLTFNVTGNGVLCNSQVPSHKQPPTPALPASRPPPVGVSRGQYNIPPPPQPAPPCEDVYETGEDFPTPAVRPPPVRQTAGGVTGGKGVQRFAALPPSPPVQQTSADDDIEEYEELDAMQAMAQRGWETPRQRPESEVEYEEPENIIRQPAPPPSRPTGRAAPTLPPPTGMAPPPTAAPPRVNGRVLVPAPQPQPELQMEETYEEAQVTLT